MRIFKLIRLLFTQYNVTFTKHDRHIYIIIVHVPHVKLGLTGFGATVFDTHLSILASL